jgi:serine protease AprX
MEATQTISRKIGIWLASIVILTSLVVSPLGLASTFQPAASQAGFIIRASSAAQAAVAVTNCGGQVTSSLDIIESVGAALSADLQSCVLSQPGVVSITPNTAVTTGGGNPDDNAEKDKDKDNGSKKETLGKAPETDYADVTGADLVWSKGKVTGEHVTVAVVDSGVETLKGLDDNRITGWIDFVDGKKKPVDPNGHGTHVAGVIANSQVGADGEANGMAPGVDLVAVRVLGEDGSGTYENVIKGIQWVVKNRAKYNIRVMNLSLVSPAQSPYWADPLDRAVTAAWASGITVVAAAGNDGPGPMTISVPGNNPYVITAGAFTDAYTPMVFDDDYLAPFSAAGPTLDGFTKPDVLAPGAHMVSTMANSSFVARNHQADRVGSDYFSMAGTSQASATVSGVVALVISAHPDLTPNQVKYRIMASALPWMSVEPQQAVYSIWQQGNGRLNAPDAVFARLSGEANLGMDIRADLADKIHYEGYSYYDQETGLFKLGGEYAGLGGGFGNWDGSYTPGAGAIGAWSGAIGAWSGAIGAWSGAIGAWSGAIGAWSGAIGAWSGAIGAWSGALGAWSGAIGAWSGAIGAWSGAIGAWSGGYTSWAGGAEAWTGSEPWSGKGYSEAGFVHNFKTGTIVSSAATVTTGLWVVEP